ncbi:MAG: GspH/FimT family pseudopilin [Gemmatimonadota bacterium]
MQRSSHGSRFVPRGRRGFSLFEMMATLAVAGIVSAVVIPSIQTQSGAHRVVEQARRVQSKLAIARARSVAEQRAYQFSLTGANLMEVRYQAEANVWTLLGSAEKVVDAVVVKPSAGTTTTITFYPNGQVDAPQTLTIADADHEQTIRVLASGMTRTEGRTK